MRQILGIPRDTPADFHLLLQRVHPVDRRAFYAIAMEPLRPYCSEHKTSEFRIVQADGSVHWVRLERLAIFFALGSVLRFEPFRLIRILWICVIFTHAAANLREWLRHVEALNR
jgi:hypothetical protein